MSKKGQSDIETPIIISSVRTRRSLGKKVKEDKICLKSESSDNAIKEPMSKRRRRDEEKEDRSKQFSRPRTRSLTFEGEVTLSRSQAAGKEQNELSRSSKSCRKGLKKQRQCPRDEPPAVRRSVRESRKVFDSLNEHTLVRSLVGDYLEDRQSGRGSNRRQLLDDVETDSQEEDASLDEKNGLTSARVYKINNLANGSQEKRPGYVSMYDIIKCKSKNDKGEDEDEEEGNDNEEKRSDEDDNSADENEEDDDDDVTPQQRYKLRENKPVTKRYTAPPLKEYHNSRRGLFSSSRVHMRERACANKEPFSPVRKSYKLKRKTINESSTSTDDDEDDDDRQFERRKAKSMAKARNRCLPMNLGLEDVDKGILADRERIGSSLADVDPMNVDRSITFDSIGGLVKHVRSLKEMVVFPLLYPEIFQKFKVNPPRGVLFHGPPGTGKTLMARALANECSQDGKKVAFFMRKGADCLSKWVGESERQLRLLFDQAFKMRPSIIFFDEIDGLAPVRSSRQDQIHSSIVSTLLALMDGLDNRGEIIVIGATNRIDSIDPALRRPGRFDREFIFPLPDKSARRNILSIHTKAWRPRLAQSFINEVADHCVGYCGADIKALCTEATLFALRRRYPQIYATKKKLILDVDTVRVKARDFAKALKTIVPACQRAAVSPGRALSSTIRPLLQDILLKSWTAIKKIFPPSISKTVGESSPGSSVNNLATSDSESSDDGSDDADIYEMDPNSTEGARVARAARAARRAGLRGLTGETGNHSHSFAGNPFKSKAVHRPRYLVCGKQGMGQSTHLSPSILHSMEHLPVHCLDLPTLFGCASKTPEEACAQVFREARRVAPSVVYLPRIESLWNTTTEMLKATFMSLVNDLPPTMPLLLFATSDIPLSRLPYDLRLLFPNELEQVFEVPHPSPKERWAYFEPLFLNEAIKTPCLSKKSRTKKPLEDLPVAPPPAPRELTVNELQKIRDDEENTLRELRIFLREITVKLMSDRRFKEFYKPVDLEEVPDYLDVIANPMDLSTMLQRVDGHEYQTCGEYLNDIDLITSNALEYNPNEDTFDRLIRHRACALKDCAHSLIKSQLDLDFEKACEEIVESRRRRGESRNVCAPKFFPVAPAQSSSRIQNATPATATDNASDGKGNTATITRMSRRVRGLDANVNIPIEHLPMRSQPDIHKTPVAQLKNAEGRAAGLHKSPQRHIGRSSRNRPRRHRRKSLTSIRKGTPRKSIPEPDHSGPEVELVDAGELRDIKDDNGTVNNGQQSSDKLKGKEQDKMGEDEKLDDFLENIENGEKRKANHENIKELKSKSVIEVDGINDDPRPDIYTKNYINSLHVRSEVQSALKSRLDIFNYDHEVVEENDRHCNGRAKESLSETNISMGTSEVSNCDSKDVAELDSVLSSSPLPVNGLALVDEGLTSQTLRELTVVEDVNGKLSEKQLEGGGGEVVPDSVENSKRILFNESSAGHEMSSLQIADSASEVVVQGPCIEDKGKFEGLLMVLVEATQKTTIETLEQYYSRIRQCILQHKKDNSREPLFEDLKLLLDKFVSSIEVG